jgi:hypothetical protein
MLHVERDYIGKEEVHIFRTVPFLKVLPQEEIQEF